MHHYSLNQERLIGTGYFRGLPCGLFGFAQIAEVGDGSVRTSSFNTVADEPASLSLGFFLGRPLPIFGVDFSDSVVGMT